MISGRALELIVRHFDAIDKAISKKVHAKSLWYETALTTQLCELLDTESESDLRLDYSLEELNRDLNSLDGLLTFQMKLETLEYPQTYERWVTQSDFGMVLSFQDHFVPQNSWSKAILCQAKRLYPLKTGKKEFNENAKFRGVDKAQHNRIVRLNDLLGEDLVKYFLYCPRPAQLDDLTRKKLTHLRNLSLTNDIFDFVTGLFMKDELSRPDSSLAAGLFLTKVNAMPKNLGEIHQKIFKPHTPFSWFLANLIFGFTSLMNNPRSLDNCSPSSERAIGIVSGDIKIIKELLSELDEEDQPARFPILPKHTVWIEMVIGDSEDPDKRVIQTVA